MGRVWLAHNEALGKDIAIKFLRTDLTAPDASARFEREARVTASVEHPAVVRVFDFGEHDGGVPYIVMERLEGQTLASLLETSGRLSAVDAVRFLLPVIDGLAKVHELGIVHRDIKPENVFLANEGGRLQPKLLDFGIARLEGNEERPVDPRLTLQGVVLGSPSYMSPEQARGQRDVDGRADVWAMCVLFYEAITGACPFEGDSYNAILTAIIEQPIAPLPESIEDAGIWAILRRGLAKDRDDRIPSMRALGQELASWLVMRGTTTDIHGSCLHESWGLPTKDASPVAHHAVEETLRSLGAPQPPPEGPSDASRPRSVAPVALGWSKAVWVPAGIVAMALAASLGLALSMDAPAFAESRSETRTTSTDRTTTAAIDRGGRHVGAEPEAPIHVATTSSECPVGDHVPASSRHAGAAGIAAPSSGSQRAERSSAARATPKPRPRIGELDLKEPY